MEREKRYGDTEGRGRVRAKARAERCCQPLRSGRLPAPPEAGTEDARPGLPRKPALLALEHGLQPPTPWGNSINCPTAELVTAAPGHGHEPPHLPSVRVHSCPPRRASTVRGWLSQDTKPQVTGCPAGGGREQGSCNDVITHADRGSGFPARQESWEGEVEKPTLAREEQADLLGGEAAGRAGCLDRGGLPPGSAQEPHRVGPPPSGTPTSLIAAPPLCHSTPPPPSSAPEPLLLAVP